MVSYIIILTFDFIYVEVYTSNIVHNIKFYKPYALSHSSQIRLSLFPYFVLLVDWQQIHDVEHGQQGH